MDFIRVSEPNVWKHKLYTR